VSRILRYEVPVDDEPHELALSGAIVHVDSRNPEIVELWAFDTGWPPRIRTFQVVGTGHTFPATWLHVGSVIVAGGALVWHLMELTP
jgi:hypothetical protein